MARAISILPALVFAFATWAIYTGGLAAIQRYCVVPSQSVFASGANVLGRPVGNALDTDGLQGVFGFSANVLDCKEVFRFDWFIMAFEFVAIASGIVAAVALDGVPKSRGFLLALFAIATVIMMIAAEAFLSGISSDYRAGGKVLTAYRVAAAGAILTVVANLVVLFAIGTVASVHNETLTVPV